MGQILKKKMDLISTILLTNLNLSIKSWWTNWKKNSSSRNSINNGMIFLKSGLSKVSNTGWKVQNHIYSVAWTISELTISIRKICFAMITATRCMESKTKKNWKPNKRIKKSKNIIPKRDKTISEFGLPLSSKKVV